MSNILLKFSALLAFASMVQAWDMNSVSSKNGGSGPTPVDLQTAGNYVILAESGITTVPTSKITGDIAVSPKAGATITGFSKTYDSSNTFATSQQVTGNIYAADDTNLTQAIADKLDAYNNATARQNPDVVNLSDGDLSGLTLPPGLYYFDRAILINNDLTLEARGPNDTWIFQTTGGLTVAAGVKVTLAGDAQAKNILWQTADVVAIGATAHMEGIILSAVQIAFVTGASLNGRAMAQTQVTLQSNTITQPAL